MDIQARSDLDSRIASDLEAHKAALPWTTRQKLALTCRMLALEGHESGLAGQATARADEDGAYWTLRFGHGFDEADEDAFIRVDDDVRAIDGNGMANPAMRFHTWIYRHRPDVCCILHTHPPHVSALSMIGEELAVAHMDATPFFEDCAYLADWPGVPVHDEEGRLISEALGRKRAILLAHHGQLVACATVEEAAVLAVQIERVAKQQLLARSVGAIRPIPAERAREAHDFLVSPLVIDMTFAYYARRVLRAAPGCVTTPA
jgi:L-fuculose-phosphate aldolase